MRRTDRIYIYPEYLTKGITRKEGRRISTKIAISNPSTLEIKLAAQKLGYEEVEVNNDAAYPRKWYNNNGVVYITKSEGEKQISKQILLRKLSTEITSNIRPMIEKKKEQLQKEKKDSLKKPKTSIQSKKQPTKKPKGIRRR